MRRRLILERAVSACVVAGAALFVLWQLHPELLVAKTLAAGGDMGAHVWGPAYLRDELLPRFRVTGWTPDWYAGYPAYHFYFPLPSLVIVVLDVVLPYEVAFKLVTVVGLVGLPVAAWAFGRLTALPFPTPPLLAVATVPFIFDRYHTIWGGNAPATLAGEFSFSISLALVLLYLGVLANGLRTGRSRALAAGLVGAAALSHLIPVAFAAGASLVVLAVHRPAWRRVSYLVTTGGAGAALTGFWIIPFLARLRYSNDMGWERTNTYVDNLLPFLRDDATAATTWHLKFVVPMALVGALASAIRGRRGGIMIALFAALAGGLFVLVPAGPIWNARFLPFWYLSLYLLAAIAASEIATAIAEFLRPDSERPHVLPLVVAPLAAAISVYLVTGVPLGVPGAGLLATADHSFIGDWARWNYSGYERKDAYPEYRELVATMTDVGRDHGCGRAMWEYEQELNRFGTPMALMLLPYWTDGCIGSMEGLFFESSATVPYHFLNQSEMSLRPSRAMRDLPYRELDIAHGVEHLQLLGVRYYMATSPEAQAQARGNPHLTLIGGTKPYDISYSDGVKPRHWEIYRVARSALVEPLDFKPAVVESGVRSKHGWLDAAVNWYQEPVRWDVPLADRGPLDWPRIADAAAQPDRERLPAVRVTDITSDEASVSFDVSRTGVPVLVKVSYFPSWKVSGARGPWRVTPNLMVVVPTERHVEMRYGRTGVDLLGIVVSLGGLALLVALARSKPLRYPEPPRPHEIWVDPFAVSPPPPQAHDETSATLNADRRQ